ncbi:MAG: hypothetical protein JW987_16235 [Anaerolineaceae bacterium]|nr:hypothetical protein [Anaerolineaceae bacterium]
MSNDAVKIVRNKLSSYPRQEGMTCGETNARTIVEGFGRSYKPLASPPLRVKWVGFSYPRDIETLLRHNGLSASVRHASRLEDPARLKLIMAHIDRDEPVILAIGDGHLQRNTDSPLARLFVGHFITVYGYNLEQQIFYIYDSWLDGDFDGEIPVGNEVRSFSVLLRDWRGPLYYPLIGMKHIYIPVSVMSDSEPG